MTNNPTIDGVSRCKTCRGSGCIDNLRSVGAPAAKCPDCAPAAERQGPEFPAGAIHNGRAFIDQLESIYAFKEQQGHPLSLCSEWQELVRCFEWLAAHATESQSTIARLEARVAGLESGRVEPVAWKFKERVWATGLSDYVWRDQLEDEKPNGDERQIRDIAPLFTTPPAPVAVVLPERMQEPTWDNGRDIREMCSDDSYVSGWNACLDATAALNK